MEPRMAALLACLEQAVLVVDGDQRVVAANGPLTTLFGVDPTGWHETAVHRRFASRVADPKRYLVETDAWTAGNRRGRAMVHLADGRIVQLQHMPVDDGAQGRVWVFADITERVQRQEAVVAEATRDRATGLLNRLGFESRSRAVLEVSAGILVVADVEPAEIGAIQAFGRLLEAALRGQDVVSRLNRETFAAFARGNRDGMLIVHRIQDAVRAHNAAGGMLTLAIGWTTVSLGGDLESGMERAFRTMNAQKRQRRELVR